jgi:hypothetical protein
MSGSGGWICLIQKLLLNSCYLEYGYHISKDLELNANITNDLK